MSTHSRYVSASERATRICEGIALWARFQHTAPNDINHAETFDDWFNFCQTNRLDDETVDYIKTAQYNAMTFAINH